MTNPQRLGFTVFVLSLIVIATVQGSDYAATKVGPQADGRVVVPTNQVLSPAGRQVYIPSRSQDLAVSPDGQTLAVLGHNAMILVDIKSGKLLRSAAFTKTKEGSGGSYKGIAFTRDGSGVIASNIGGALELFDIPGPGTTEMKQQAIELSNGTTLSIPAGFALDASSEKAWVALCVDNQLAEVDLKEGKILRRIPVGQMPFDVCLHGNKAYVSLFGGSLPQPGDTTAPSGGAPRVKADPVRFIASEGMVSVVDLEKGVEVKEIEVGLHPSGMVLSRDGSRLFVANANSDTVSIIDASSNTVVETVSTQPKEGLLFGSAPNDLILSEDEKRLYVSNGTNNSVCVVDLAAPGSSEKSRIIGFIPTAWYPAGLDWSPDKKTLFVANIKGIGSRRKDLVEEKPGSGLRGGTELQPIGHPAPKDGYNTHEQAGSISIIPIPPDEEIIQMSKVVEENNRMTESISALAPPRPDAPPRPVPQRHGEPSVFEHVVYIIKENRTYDQIFGDIPEGNGDPNLCIYGEEVTPNCHKLVKEFVLLDNFYCSGVLSADGHQWVTESYATSYLEKAFGGFPRSYPYDGGDALAYASSGFLWDNCFKHGKTFRTYGEFVDGKIRWKDPARQAKGGPRFKDCYDDFINRRGEIEVIGKATIESLEPHTCPIAIGWPAEMPDLYRADVFINELRQFEKNRGFPNLSMILLPNDHTSGTRPHMPTPKASVADNDRALGLIVEAISHSSLWPRTCILVVQDDPQNGFDHVDGHRTLAMVISPYTKRGAVVSTNYNQTSMARTIELMLGLPPMNQLDSSAIPMTDCFTDEINLKPYDAVPNRIPLDQINPEVSMIDHPQQRYWAEKSMEIALEDIDEAPEDTLNRILWHDAKGYDTPYPEQFVFHGVDDDDE